MKLKKNNVSLRDASSCAEDKVFEMMKTGLHGLSGDEADARLEEFGVNDVRHEKKTSWFKLLLGAMVNPFIGILLFIAGISAVIDIWLPKTSEEDYSTVIMVGVMVAISVALRFIQELRSNNAAEQLKNMVQTTANVERDGVQNEIDIRNIVPGDIIHLSAGDIIPADCRILQQKDLYVVQSALTGESLPVEKSSEPYDPSVASRMSPLEMKNLCFMGTNVISGSALAVALNTGDSTYFGSLSKVAVERRAETGFDKGLKKVSYLLITFMAVMVPIMFIVNGFVKHDWVQALLFAVAIAVGLTPEMLPMIVTANLAKGAVNMSKHKVIVKRLDAIQNIGAMDTLCTDKTGTLTIDRVVLERHLNIMGESDEEVLRWTYLNSYYQTGLKSLLDVAILQHCELKDILKIDDEFKKVDEIPFDFQRRRMSVVLERKDGSDLLICKGAVEEMLALCSHAFDPGDDKQLQIDSDGIVEMTDDIRRHILDMSEKLNEEGMRVLIMAVRKFNHRNADFSSNDENDMVMAGFIGFLDPAKPSAGAAIKSLQEYGVAVKVLTGDNEVVSKKICRDVGISFDRVLLGSDIENMSDEELGNVVDDVAIFAKLSPMQKARIVGVLRKKGHTVGFMGDGINDAAALKSADVGISVDTAVDIAKDSADMILLEKDLMILRTGVVYGRVTFGNIMKYIKMTTSGNFGNMLSMLGASIFLPFLPMLPIQILMQNMLYDFSQTSIPWDTVDDEYIRKPKVWDTTGLSRYIFTMGPVSSLFDYLTFAVMFFIFGANSVAHQSLFQTGWFVEGLLSQVLVVHMIRTTKIPFIQSRAATPVLAMSGIVMALGVALPYTPAGAALKMAPLPLAYFPYLVGILLVYSIAAHFASNMVEKSVIRQAKSVDGSNTLH